MKIEAKELIDLIGIEVDDEATIDIVKEKIEQKYIDLNLHKATLEEEKTKLKKEVEGNILGSKEVQIKRALKNLGFSDEEIKEKKVEELFTLFDTKSSDIKRKLEATGKGKEDIEALQKQIEELQALNKAKENEVEEFKKKIELVEQEGNSKLQNYILQNKIKSLYDGSNWTDDSDDIVKEGVWSKYINGKFQFKETNEEVFVYDQDGNIVKDGTSQLTASKLFEKTLKETKRFKMNDGRTGKPAEIIAKEAQLSEKQKQHNARIEASMSTMK